jgi:hypothetical protein
MAASMPVHVELLGVLFVLWGAMTTMIGASTLALAVAAASLIASASDQGGRFAAGLTAATFTALGIIALLWGVTHIAVGFPVRQRRPWSRLAAIVLGSMDLVLLPYGTVLGCYTLWTLLREDGKKLFQQ